jgi:hypothetical protein
VSGQVLLDGKPLPGGKLTFRSTGPKSLPVTRTIDENGNYEEVDLPAGEVAVMVDNRALKPPPPRGPITLPKGISPEMAKQFNDAHSGPPPQRNQAGKYVPIPERYYDGENGELKFTVQSGTQKHDIELKSK